MTKLSNTAVNLYNQCSFCYYLHYKEGIRPVKTSSALVFGSALDTALNHLLLNRKIIEAKSTFYNEWFQYKTDPNIVYFKSDLDEELLNHLSIYDNKNLEWQTLMTKGMMFIDAYYNEVLPKIKKVLSVQEPISIKNNEGDEISGFLDLVVEWEDGKTYLMDNKSSGRLYDANSAKEGQQIPLYHYAVKDKYKLDGIGYIVLIKKINMNKTKTCTKCERVNNSSHKKCNEEFIMVTDVDRKEKVVTANFKRCNGDFKITINPSVDIQYVFNKVEESDENRVLEAFDKANYGISNNLFANEHVKERGKYGFCPYREFYEGSPDFYKKELK